MRGSRNFREGGPGQHDKKKSSDNFFFLSVLSLFYRSQMVNFKEIYHFSSSRGGPTFSNFPGGRGSNFFQGGGGSDCLFPLETHLTCDFPGGGSRPPVPPLDPHLIVMKMAFICKHKLSNFEHKSLPDYM